MMLNYVVTTSVDALLLGSTQCHAGRLSGVFLRDGISDIPEHFSLQA